jgi:enoyl-CoA hydratase
MLAKDLAALPQRCLRSDRLSAMEQWSLGWREAMLNEFHRGMAVINSGESKEGATRFASGAGRHGASA